MIPQLRKSRTSLTILFHSNESGREKRFCGSVYYAVLGGSNF